MQENGRAPKVSVIVPVKNGADYIGECIGCLKSQTFRFAPGYGDVPLSLQKQIFDNIPETSRMGLTLDGGCLMHPFKSMTGIIGFVS